MAAFSFLDAALYADSLPDPNASPDQPQMAQRSDPPRPASPPNCIDSKTMEGVMEALYTRVVNAEKRTALMEEKVLHAIERNFRERPRTNNYWQVILLVVCILALVCFLTYRSSAARSLLVPQPTNAGFYVSRAPTGFPI